MTLITGCSNYLRESCFKLIQTPMNITADDPPNERMIADRFNYELATLDRFIAKDISSFLALKCSLDDQLVSDFKQTLNEEIEQIKNNFINAVFGFEEERYLERYIQYHQRALIRLAGNLLNYVQPENLGEVSNSVTPEILSQYTYKLLQELLDFIEKHFSKYFDQNAWIPLNYRLIMLHDIKTNIDALKEILTQHGTNKHLIHIALLPLENFLKEDTSNEVTYRRIIYLKELKKQLFQMKSNEDVTDVNQSMKMLLFYLNFNSPEYYNHCIRQLEEICEKAESDAKRIEQLALHQKFIHQTQLKPGFVLNPALPFLKDQLAHWINQEISFLEKRHDLIKDSIEMGIINESDYKIKIDLSVAQFAYFVKLLVEVKIIQNKNIVQLLRFLAKLFKTDHSEEISPGSVRNHYYSTEASARESIKSVLKRMIQYIDDNTGTP